MCKSNPYPPALGILGGYLSGSNSRLLCSLFPLYQIVSASSPVSTRESTHTECLVTSLQVCGWQGPVGLGSGAEAHGPFHLCSNLCLTFPFFHPSHRPPDCFLETANIFPLTRQKDLALFCPCSKLSFSNTSSCLQNKWPAEGSQGYTEKKGSFPFSF